MQAQHDRSLGVLVSALALALASASTAWALENVNMNVSLNVEGGHVVVHWTQGGFHHYNVRWKEGRGEWQQVERDADKRFRYLSAYRPGVVYRVAVQGCDKAAFSRSSCTSWEEASCGEKQNSCARKR